MSITLVVGNGESRLSFDYREIKHDIIIGCNAVYRDIYVDHLICCDRRMAQEVCDNIENKNTLIYVRDKHYHYFRKIKKLKNIRELPDIPFVSEMKRDQPDHWGSGPYAVLVAAKIGNAKIVLIGFDLYSADGKFNNVYKDTKNYNKSNSQAVDHSYWVHQISQVFAHYSDKEFIIVNDQNWEIPRQWKLDNVQFKNFGEFFLDNKYLSN
jgi:hypothetical protein